MNVNNKRATLLAASPACPEPVEGRRESASWRDEQLERIKDDSSPYPTSDEYLPNPA